MRVVFMGTAVFAAEILGELAEHHEVLCVYTMPDKVRSRGKTLEPSPVKSLAQQLNLPVRTPSSLKDNDTEIEFLKQLSPDAICVAAYGKILPEAILHIPKFGCLNVHASLLPRWRGAAPIERAILAGDTQVGVCIMQMEEGLDTGDFCVRRSIDVAGKSASEITLELALIGSSALITALEQIQSGSVFWTSQDSSQATYANKVEKGELNLAPSVSAHENVRRILASSCVHPARFRLNDNDITAISAQVVDDISCDDFPCNCDAEAKVFVTKKRLILKCEDGSFFELGTIKPAGKKEMPVTAYLAGAKLDNAATWNSIA